MHVVRNACAKPPGLKNVIRASLHCYQPKQNKDKIYLITAHSPGGTEYVVKTHWGPRDAKRLASMVKVSGLTSEAYIKAAVKAIVFEKTRGPEGYQRKPWRSLLTDDAVSAMAAELAVAAPATRVRKATAVRKGKSAAKKTAARRTQASKPSGGTSPATRRRT